MTFSSRIKFLIVRIIVFLLRPFAPSIPKKYKDGRNILFIRNDGLGDLLLFLPAVSLYRKHKPNRRLILFCTQAMQELAEKSSLFDAVIPIANKNDSLVWRDLLLFSVFPAEMLINTRHGRNAMTDVFAMLSPAGIKVCFSMRGQPLAEVEKIVSYERFYTHTVPFRSRFLMRQQHCDTAAELLGIERVKCPVPEFPPDHNSEYPLPEKYYVLVPGSEDRCRMWSVANYRELIRRLEQLIPDVVPVITGTGKEFGIGEAILADCERGLNLCGKLSLLQLGAVLKNAAFTAGNDTGGTHFSAAVKTKTFVVLGGGHYGVYMPDPEHPFLHCVAKEENCFDCSWNCRKDFTGAYPCIEAVTVDDLLDLIREETGNLRFFQESP